MLSLFFAASASCESGGIIKGRVVGVHDGDSITLLSTAEVQVKIRLEGIDAPELKQPFGTRSKTELSTLVFGKEVSVAVKGKDRYQRTLGRVFCENLDVNLEMVRRGMAWRYVKYSSDAALIAAEQTAKAARKGLWSDPAPVPPWEWRKPKPKTSEVLRAPEGLFARNSLQPGGAR